MKQNSNRSIFLLLICLAAVMAVTLVIPVSRTRAYWIALVFFVISVCVALDAAFYARKKGAKKSKFLKCNLAIIYWCYVLCQMVFSLATLVWIPLSASYVMAISVILLVICQVFLVPSESTMQEDTMKAILNMRRKK